MAIQHPGGTIVNTTFTGSSRAAIADGIKDALVAAGWSVASSSGSDYKLDSATSPQSLQMRVRVWDPGSGNCAQIRIFNVTETMAPAQSAFLLPGGSKTFRVIANKYQCFVIVPGSVTARDFAAFGLPYLPPHLDTVITEAGWLINNAATDTDTATRQSWRTSLWLVNAAYATICNGNAVASTGNGIGAPRLQCSMDPQLAAGNMMRDHDDSYEIHDARVGWGLTAVNVESKRRGQLWGAFVDSADRTADATFTFNDGSGAHDFIVITNENTAQARGTLCLAID